MQKCSKCSVILTEETAYKKTKLRLQSQCKSCFNDYCIQRWINRKKQAVEYKGGKCEICGYAKYYGALDFHHQDPLEKEADWGKIRLWNWEKIKNELDKCICVCSNCHREIHGNIDPLA